ncbi:DeoR/GlpR family transcriptional regulator of sugar metabolism [Paenibacillus phyllosphaerae]|uniref:DeoR/GlpR family transcriptional regulator of sugar metabolism n=1 Tax=Paenibacillus phyllosphaerae TaxID=274593 RepID=A0A7W5AWI1_9BACL|nr:DeoR/GlpR family DNA-binding transcription regulator [Paenibacillus phyllosphaerae]MBB3109531.1 DeoR/GlpR family transcriptional regulator of sugar metabolism [Paenibacillus phyllosphaerae]
MNSLRRHEKIMEALLELKEVTVNELSERLDVTGKTIREDLAKLEEKGLLLRVHGGAVLAQGDQLGILSPKGALSRHQSEKSAIAELALRYIEPGDIIALDGGSTTLEIARRLDNFPLTVVTNDLHIIAELVRKDEIRLVVPGGYRVRNMLAGPEAVSYIQALNIRKAFIAATGVHLQYGFTIYTNDLIDYKRAIMTASEQVFGVVDHHKLGQSALRTFASLSEVTRILTDDGCPPDLAAQFRSAGIDIEYE